MSDSYAGAAVTPARIEERGEPEPNWHPILRIAFRFVFAYLVLYMLVGAPLGVILSIETQFGTAPGGKALQKGIEKVWTPVVTWVGHHVYHFPLQDSGSSTEFDSILSVLLLSVLIASVWVALERRPGRDIKLYRGLRDVVRYVLAFVLVLYGMDK